MATKEQQTEQQNKLISALATGFAKDKPFVDSIATNRKRAFAIIANYPIANKQGVVRTVGTILSEDQIGDTINKIEATSFERIVGRIVMDFE